MLLLGGEGEETGEVSLCVCGCGGEKTYPTDALLRPVVAVYKSRVGGPRPGRLVLEFLPTVVGADALLYLPVDGLLDAGLDSFQLRCEGSDVLYSS